LLKDGIAGLLTGTNINNVTNVNNAIERALRTFLGKATIPEASTSQIVTLYDGVTDYLAPSSMFGSTIKDIRPIGQTRQITDMAFRDYGEDFDRKKQFSPSGARLTFETENGLRIMRVKTRYTPSRVVLDPMSATTGWVASGSASLLTQDKSFYYMNPASLRFTLTGASVGILTKTLTSPVDLTPYLNVGVGFLELELSALKLSSIEARIGSDASNYYLVNATQGQLGAWTLGQFNDTPFDTSGATIVGSPDITKIKYVRLAFTTSDTISNVRCGYLFVAMPSPHKILYTTTGVFQTEDGSISNYIKTDDDVILLDDSAYNIFEHECALTIGLQNGGSLANGVIASINGMLNGARSRTGAILQLGLYDRFKADNPSEEIGKLGNWYLD
jgi:hypothetical protein